MAIFTSRKQQQNFKVSIEGDMLYVEKPDGKQAAFPLAFYPGLKQATEEERNRWTVTAYGIKWNDLDIEIPV